MNFVFFLPALAVAFFALMVACLEIGFRAGLRKAARHPDDGDEGTGAIEAAIFALFGLILAFSFSGAMSRLDDRRAMIVSEANAIGTAYLRLDLLEPADREALRGLFREYVDSRIAMFGESTSLDEVLREIDRGSDLQGRIWSRAVTAVQSDRTLLPARTLVLPALNDMIDITSTRKVAMFTHLPDLILWLVVVIALISALIAGFAMSRKRKGKRNWFHLLLYPLVISITMYIILDLEYPRVGLIRLDTADQALVDLRASMR